MMLNLERKNLTLCNQVNLLNRKTLDYSKPPEMHNKVINTFIEREYYF
ncbi:Insertion element iso-IS1n protein InsB (fragment) [Xenorhabdus bovienii str. feltiae Moldova]|uniref:Insertion element iso-IS1n protein InsB n=1 Tax=Xenorhabdus bovienii str. feltiae Moldova TaxID=1398200 RepID=A0A077NNE3_XENBV